MTPEQVKASYRKALREHVTVRRYTSSGTNRTYVDVPNVRARVVGYNPDELVSGILQGDRRAILYADDVASIAPITGNDRVLVGGRSLAILAVDRDTRKVADVLIAYELQLRG